MDLKIGTNTDSIIAAIKMALINYEDNNLFSIFNPEYQLTFVTVQDSPGKTQVNFYWRASSLHLPNSSEFSFTLLGGEEMRKIGGYIDDLANEIHRSVVAAEEEDSTPVRQTGNYFSPDGIH